MFKKHDYVYVNYNNEKYFARVTNVIPGGYTVMIQLQVGKKDRRKIEKEVDVPACDVTCITIQSAA